MNMSPRAQSFLLKSRRDAYPSTENDIRAAFLSNNAPIFQSLIDFQINYGGYIFYAGRAPIKFSLLKGEGGHPGSGGTAIIDFEESNVATPRYFFNCAATDYQMQFFLDEQGIYYEDYEAKASSFEKVIEHLALWDEMRGKEGYELIYRDKRLKINDVDRQLNLTLLPEASDQFTIWFKNEFMYMQQWQGLTTLIVSKDYPEKNKLESIL